MEKPAHGETGLWRGSLINSVRAFRVFASFDIERDQDLLARLVAEGHIKGAKYTVFDRSISEPPTPESAEKLRERMSRVDAVVILCGEWTHRAPNVANELKVAQELGKR